MKSGKVKILFIMLSAILCCGRVYSDTESKPLKLTIPSDYYSFGFYSDEAGSTGVSVLTLMYDSSSSVTTSSNSVYASNTFYVGWTIASRYSLNIVMSVADWSSSAISFVAKTETGKTALAGGDNIVSTLLAGSIVKGSKCYKATVSMDGVQTDHAYSTTVTLKVVVI